MNLYFKNLKIKKLEAENDELQAELHRLKNFTWCAYCGKEYQLDDIEASEISKHIRTCEKHPMSKLQAENAELNKTIEHVTKRHIEHEEKLEAENERLRDTISHYMDCKCHVISNPPCAKCVALEGEERMKDETTR